MLKRRMFALISFATIFLLSVTIAACSSSPAAGTPDTSAPSGNAESGSAAPAEGEKIQLTFWMSGSPTLEAAMDDILKSFMAEYPNIMVVRETFPYGEYSQKLFTSFSGGNAPDVFWIDVLTAAFADQGMLLPLDSYITDENRADVIDSAWIEPTWKGVTYSMPLHQLTEALYVNTRMATDAGIEIPKTMAEAWTWEDMNNVTEALTVRNGDQTTVWGFSMERFLQDWSLGGIIRQGGGSLLSPDLTQAEGYLNSPKSVAAIEWVTNLVKEKHVMPAEPIPDGFATGQVAVYQGTSTYRSVLDKNFPDMDYTVAPLFVGPAGCAATSGGWNVGIASTSKNPDAAWLLVDWMTRERHLEWVEKSGYLPIRTSVMSDPQFADYPWTIFLDTLRDCSVTRPAIPEYQLYYDLMKAAGTNIAVGGDAQTILDNVAATLDKEIAKRK